MRLFQSLCIAYQLIYPIVPVKDFKEKPQGIESVNIRSMWAAFKLKLKRTKA
jgi:hypothetical protein